MRIQQVRKVRRQRRPGYPTRPQVHRDPELLRRHVPSAWKKSAQVTAALSIMVASAYAEDVSPKGETLKVSPIFEHGEGFGSEGCIIMNPPRFLAEEEALRIIVQELGKAGLPPPERNKTLPGLMTAKLETGSVEVPDPKDGKMWSTLALVENGQIPLTLQFFEPAKRIAIVYVSKKDEQFLLSGDMKEGRSLGSSVKSRNFVKAAEWVRGQIKKNTKAPDAYYGVLYDPCPPTKEPDIAWTPSDRDSQKKYTEAVKAANSPEPQNLLRAQVRDFIEWLKGQGAI